MEQKRATYTEEEDQDYFDYEKAIEEYNNDTSDIPNFRAKATSRYEKGSLLQRMFEPFAFCERDDKGTLVFKADDSDIEKYMESDEKLKELYE